MKRSSIIYLAYTCAALSVTAVADAGNHLDLYEVAKVTPSRLIKHDVTIQGRFDAARTVTDLKGPEFFSQPVGMQEKRPQDRDSCLNWYRITNAKSAPKRVLSLRDHLHGSNSYQLRLGSAEFLLSPARRLTSGSPSEASDRLSYFKAYRIIEAPQVDRQVELNDSFGPSGRQVVRAALLCIPVEQWHHHEHFPIQNPKDCLVVYELQPHKHDAKTSTLDQFGLNELNIESCVWLSVPAQIVADGSASIQGPASQ